MKHRAIFMDRDGTICEEAGYVNHVSRCRLLPGSLEALGIITRSGFLGVLVTNQSGVARGFFPESLVHRVHEQLQAWAVGAGARLDGFYYCPHHPTEGHPPYRLECECRKPLPGMLLRASRELDIDLSRSYMIGDTLADIGAGHACGATVIHVLTGYGRGLVEHQPNRFRHKPAHTAEDLLAAVRWIQEREVGPGSSSGSGVGSK